MCPVGCHCIGTGYSTQGYGMLVGTLIAHHTYTANSRKQDNTYIDNSGNTIDLCTQGENIDDSEIVAGIFKISYLGNNSFSDISYVSTKTIVKDIKSCN